VGGTLGGPWEGQRINLFLHDYDPMPSEPMPNDDLELQLVWLDMLRKRGILLRPQDFVYHWQHHAQYFISEYFMGQRNMAAGLLPPACGAFNNWWTHGMGATIRSEIWGMIAPGRPDLAAAYAYLDSSTDHDREGVYGAMFFAALESAAFVEDDPWRLVETGLNYVPPGSEVRGVVDLVCGECRRGSHWRRIRELVCADYSHWSDFTYAPTNLGFIVLGLLSSDDYSEALLNAVNCGYDTDCTGATLGAILGIVRGGSGTPEHWLRPVGREVVVTDFVPGIEYGRNLDDVTDHVCAIGEEVLAREDEVRCHLARWTRLSFLDAPGRGFATLPDPYHVRLEEAGGVALEALYGSDPSIGAGEDRRVTVLVRNESGEPRDWRLAARAPEAWSAVFAEGASEVAGRLGRGEELRFPLRVSAPAEVVLPGNSVRLELSVGDGRCGTGLAFAGKQCWHVTGALDPEDEAVAWLADAGRLDPEEVGVKRLLLATDSLTDLVPGPGQVVYAQTVFRADTDFVVRLVANSISPLRAWLNGELVIDKPHVSCGILPTWHLQVTGTHLLPKELGWKDVRLVAGDNALLLELRGTDGERDTNVHLAEFRAGTSPQNGVRMGDVDILRRAWNTEWR
jgi:ADP-ribosylglycohydrolase